MNFIFVFFIASAIIFSFFSGNQSGIFDIITSALGECGEFMVKIIFLTGFFSGIMRIAEESGTLEKLCSFIVKIINRIFKTKDKTAKNKIALNISANMLGIGNAATPAGLEAMKELDRINGGSRYPSYDMCKFMIFNTCSVQLIPTGVMSIRAMAGSSEPSKVILPVIIVSFASLIFGLTVLKLLFRKGKK